MELTEITLMEETRKVGDLNNVYLFKYIFFYECGSVTD